ncbi:MAG: hypothetical protein JWM27_3510 [Gemmatimonadetes bacterium]|nr:hypothetical protein [Gemmatimonadota bacterium]
MLRSAARRSAFPLAAALLLVVHPAPLGGQAPADVQTSSTASRSDRSARVERRGESASTATPSAAEKAGPEPVRVGIYVRDVYDVNLKAGTYFVDFDLWFEWTGDVDPTGFSILNGTREQQDKEAESTGPKGRSVTYRCQYRFHEPLDQRRYPLDAHVLRVMVEDGQHTVRELTYVPDRRWALMDPRVRLPGWILDPARVDATRHTYPPLGSEEAGAADEVYSHFELGIPLRRPGAGIFLKTFLVMFISVGVGFLATLLSARQVDARLGLGLASVFGVVSSYVVAAGSLPETGEFTLTDKLHVLAMAVVFLSILASVAVFRLGDRLGERRAERLDTGLGIATVCGFALAVLLICRYA